MFNLTIKELLARKGRLFSTALAVLLGVTLMAGTLIFTDTMTATFDSVLADAHAGVDAAVRAESELDRSTGGLGPRLPAEVADQIATVDGVDTVAIEVTGYAQLVGHDGDAIGDPTESATLGYNWIDHVDLNPYRIVEGTPPRHDGEIVVNRGAADDGEIEVGDTVTVLTQLEPTAFTVSGIATFGSEDSAAGSTSVLFTDDTAERYLATPGMVDNVLVHAVDGVSQDELVTRLDNVVPELDVISGADLIADDQAAFAEDAAAFKVFLLAFAFIAVFVGAFMINNTFSITVAQRTAQLAMLRALGASRRQVVRTVLLEALVIGLLGSLAGLVAGFGVAVGLTALFAAVGLELPDGAMVISTGSMVLSASVGVVVTMFSAWLPARRAGRVPPVAALRDVAVERTGTSRRRIVVGTAVTGIGAASLLAGLAGGGIALVGLGALLTLIGVAALGPVLAPPITSVLGLGVARRGISGELAVRNTRRSPKRTARTASALMIGVAMVTFIAVLASSVKTSFGGSVSETFTGSHIVDSGSFDGAGGFSEDLAAAMIDDPSIDVVTEARVSAATVDGNSVTLNAFTASTIASIFDVGDVVGDLGALEPDGIAVEADYAADHDWSLGAPVEITMASGTHTATVAATYDGAAEWVGKYFVDIAAFDTYAPAQLDFRVYAVGDDAAVRAVASSYANADVLDAAEFQEQLTGEIDQMLGVVYALLALAVIIALLGITNTLALSIFERTHEIGLLRAVGMVQAQVRSAIRWEAIMIALFGTALGLGIGSFFGWASVRALASEGIDQFTYPIGTVVTICVIAALAGATAAIVPARRAARLDVLEALAAD